MKSKLYLVLSILVIISLLASAAICNLGQAGNNDEDQGQVAESDGQDSSTKKESSDKTKSSESSSDSKADTSSDGNDKKDKSKSDDKKDGDKNSPPVISGIYLDSMDPVNTVFFTGNTYTVRAEAADPEGSNLAYKWSGDGNISGDDVNPMSWTAPGAEGDYKLTVEVTDDKGAKAEMTVDLIVIVEIIDITIPEILSVEVLGSDSGLYEQHTWYTIKVNFNDPDGLIDHFDFQASCGNFGQVSGNTVEWESPGDAVNCDITANIIDEFGDAFDSMTITISVEPAPV